VHISYLLGFKNKLFVLAHWTSSCFTCRKGARLTVNKVWRLYKRPHTDGTNSSK